jgi:hypothetical protein
MIMKIISSSFAVILFLGMTLSASAQDPTITQKQVVVNPDGSYSVIEYPVGKEVRVTFSPSGKIVTKNAYARVMRTTAGTKVYFDFDGLPAEGGSYYAYAVDPAGVPTLLGPITVTDGIGRAEFSTPLNQFMLVVSPTESMSTYSPSDVLFTSAVPSGYVVVPRRNGTTAVVPVSEGATFAYNVPLLNIPKFGEKEREIKLKFDGELSGLNARVLVDREKGATKVKMTVDNLKRVPANKRLVLWTYAPDGKFSKLGQIINTGRRDDTTIQSETGLADFGLFVTVEDGEVEGPTSRIYQAFTVSG